MSEKPSIPEPDSETARQEPAAYGTPAAFGTPQAYPAPANDAPPAYPAPPQNHSQQNYNQPNYSQPGYAPGYAGAMGKNKVLAGLLGILLGAFGVHNFYLGYTGKAVAQLLITVLSLGFLSFVSAIWGFTEGILILIGSDNFRTDAKGIPLVG
ncbi:TM2 domain-containing protein [Arthrobacter russicus]|uniref:TM2 domain-containing membrane protein YozV n=1 Tax=Arthrobacter russicus TaxID=172040 RepID=A0ABU1JA29_9MICC|nr:NINE protein [Arthrobacter russicus]MDR6269268.1 TM2 domain-containing membrane protein YozV [Arthrobacter russicus]